MAEVQTDVFFFKDDVGKNLYRKKTYYTLVVEQDVLAKDKDEADTKFTDFGGLKHSAVNKEITERSQLSFLKLAVKMIKQYVTLQQVEIFASNFISNK